MEQLTRKYPNDVEAKVFYALGAEQKPRSHSDKTYAKQLKAVKILAPIDARVSRSSGRDALPYP